MSAEIVNLRAARKRAKRDQDEKEAAAKRIVHGTPKALRRETDAKREKAKRDHDGHRLDRDE